MNDGRQVNLTDEIPQSEKVDARNHRRHQIHIDDRSKRTIEMLSNSVRVDQMQRQSAAIARLIDSTALNSQVKTSLRFMNDVRLADQIALAVKTAYPSFGKELDHLSGTLSQLQNVVNTSMSGITEELAASARLAQKYQISEIAKGFRIDSSVASQLHGSLVGMDTAFSRLSRSLQSVDDVIRRPAFVLPGATYEMIATDRVMESLRTRNGGPTPVNLEFQDEPDLEDLGEESDLIGLFGRVDPVYASMYTGVLDALNGDNPERVRHVLSTLRELATNLLHELAPNEEVKPWIDGVGEEGLIHDGKPTRRARILYIFRNESDHPLSDFMYEDATTMGNLFNAYNRLHKKEIGVSDHQLRIIVYRTGSFWRFLLRVLEITKN